MRNKTPLTGIKRKNSEKLTQGFRGIFVFLFTTSGIINILALTGSFYMLQIYDRALTSGSVPTLVALSTLAIGLYLFQGSSTSSGRRCWCVWDRVSTARSRQWHIRSQSTCHVLAFPRPRRWSAVATSILSADFWAARGRSPCSICRGCRSIWFSSTCCILISAHSHLPAHSFWPC